MLPPRHSRQGHAQDARHDGTRREAALFRAALVTCLFAACQACGGAASQRTAGFNPPIPDSRSTADPPSDFDFARRSLAPGSPDQVGLATWYGASLAGRKTASGERFDPSGLTAAHRTLKMGTWVEVRRPDTGRTIRVRINDRGPFGDKRKIIDLARAAADRLGIVREGAARVELRVVRGPE